MIGFIIIVVIGLAIAGWLHFSKAGQAELTALSTASQADIIALETRIKALETVFRGAMAAKVPSPDKPMPVPAPPKTAA